MKIVQKNGMIKRVYWQDISNLTHRVVKKPFKENLAVCWSLGYVFEDKDTVIVIYGGSDDKDWCFDAIPRGCVIKIVDVGDAPKI